MQLAMPLRSSQPHLLASHTMLLARQAAMADAREKVESVETSVAVVELVAKVE